MPEPGRIPAQDGSVLAAVQTPRSSPGSVSRALPGRPAVQLSVAAAPSSSA